MQQHKLVVLFDSLVQVLDDKLVVINLLQNIQHRIR